MQNRHDLEFARAHDDALSPRVRLLNLQLEVARKRRPPTRMISVRVKRDAPIPLSFAQERLWFLDQVGLVGTTYNMQLALRLSGKLDDRALERSFVELIRRHEVLRTRFGIQEGAPHQKIDPPGVFQLHRANLSDLAIPLQREQQLRELKQRELLHRFDLSEGPLFRVALVSLNTLEFALLMTMHHIVSDGWSHGILVQELSSLYAAYVRGQPSPLPGLAVQYADYAIWQRQWLQGEVLQNQLKYWSERLAGAPPQLQLPTDRQRPPEESFRGGMLRFHLPAKITGELDELARRDGATLFMVMLAAYQLLLSRWSGQQDIVVGSPIAGRKNREVEGLIGFFVNTLVLRTDVSGNPTFRQLLKRVKGLTLGAYAHQDLPFEVLVKELHPERNLAHQPIFQVALAFQNYPEECLELPGIKWTGIDTEYVNTHVDLTLYLFEQPDGISGTLEYARDLFDQDTIERFVGHFQTLLEGIVAEPDCPIARLRLLREDERQELLQWHGPQTGLPPESDVVSMLQRRARSSPDATAICGGDRALSYRALNARANRLARCLCNRGVRRRDHVGVYAQRGVECVVAFYAILKAGAVYVPLDPGYPQERLVGICRDADVGHILVQEQGPLSLDLSTVDFIPIDKASGLGTDRDSDDDDDLHRPFDPTAPAYAIYTSGSTGRPKGVLLHHLGLANVMAAQRNVFMLDATERIVQLAAISFDASVFEFVLALGAGACLFYGTREELLPGTALTAFLERHSVTIMTITPSALSSLSPEGLPSLRTIIAAGEDFPPELARGWLKACRVFNAYGPTESTIWATIHECSAESIRGRVPIGRPIDNLRVYVLDSNLNAVAVGEIGELCVGGLGVALGYINRPDLTADRFIDDPVCFGQGKIYRTGDMARWRPDGNLEFVGRKDNQVKVRGYRIEPAEIEAVLLEHPAVKSAVVLAREDTPGELRLVSYVVGDRNVSLGSASGESHDRLRNEIVSEWETLYEETYGSQRTTAGPNFAGWNSSYTGQPIPASEMQEWLTDAIARIQALRPRRLLEVGCGVGLLLQHLAPECAVYVGTDISTSALEQLRRWIGKREEFGHVELLHRSATELQDLQSGSFDTVVLNSVVQYFPDIDYLRRVVQDAIRLLSPGGKIFIGDVRHLGLLPTFHSAVQLSKAAATVSAEQLRTRILRAIAQEKELVIAPQFFQLLPGLLPGVGAVEVHLKRGRMLNELTRYRYDVVLHTSEQIRLRAVCESVDWKTDVGSFIEFESALGARRWRAVRLCMIPNGRLASEWAAHKLIETSDARLEAGTLRRQVNELHLDGVDPEMVWEAGQAHGYDVQVSWSKESPGCFEVQLLDRARTDAIPQHLPVQDDVQPWGSYANDPMENGFRQQLIQRLREYLRGRLPEYMIPSAWMTLKELPLTPNGKVDRRALPAPQSRPEEIGDYIAPRTELERTLADIWAQTLRVDQVGVQDNFFELGGHSLLIVQLMERLRRVGLSTNVRIVYENPTLEALARKLAGETPAEFIAPPNLIPPGSKTITPQMLPLIDLEPEQIERIVQSVPGGATNIQDIYPLAPLQEGMLFHHLLNERGGDAYARSLLLSASSREKLEVLISALQKVIDRHDVLRTAVLWEELPQPVQVVYRQATLEIEELVLERTRDPIAQLMERMGPEQQRIDFRHAPLMRAQIARDACGTKWYALLQTHHLVFDNESVDILLAEVMAYAGGLTKFLPQPVPYRNHVAQALASTRTQDAKSFFCSKLGDIDEPTAPFGLLNVHGDGTETAEARQALDWEPARQIRAQARRLSVSAAILFHAAWGLVVARTSGRDDVVYGTVLSGRLHGSAGAQRILGMFINALPLRIRLCDVTSGELVEHTQRELTELLNHEQASLAMAQRCSGISGSAPLFSSLFNYVHRQLNPESEPANASGITLLANRGSTNYPLLLTVYDQGEGFVLEVQTDRRLDPNRVIGYVSTAMQSLVESLERGPHALATSLAILPESEMRQLIETLNATSAVVPACKLIHEIFEQQVQRTPTAVAVVCEGLALTYAELNAKANQLARALRVRGIGPDRLVGICVDRSLELVVGLLGVLKAGGAYVPLDPVYPVDRLKYMLSDSGPKVLLTQGRLTAVLPESPAEIIALDEDWSHIAQHDSGNLDLQSFGIHAHQLAYVIYTSGSTGKPKGVMVEHAGLVNLLTSMQQDLEICALDSMLAVTTLSFDIAALEIYLPLISGAKVYLASRPVVSDANLLIGMIEQCDISIMQATPATWQLLLSGGWSGRSTMKALCGGEALTTALSGNLSTRVGALWNLYGPTETTIWSCTRKVETVPDRANSVEYIGRPIANTQTYIFDRNRELVPLGVAGEIYIGGAGVARGYLNRPELTAERFIVDPFSSTSDARLYRTGDLGRWRRDGMLEYLGRNDQQVKVRGFRIELGEIEAQLVRHGPIGEAVVVAREDVPGEKRLVAYVVPRTQSAEAVPSKEVLCTHLRATLPEHMIPSAFVTLDALPMTPNGKLDRHALPAPEFGAYLSPQYEPPMGEIEVLLTRVWQELLRVERIGRKDNFFELGGHSLLATRLITHICHVLDVELPLRILFECPTIEGLSDCILREIDAELLMVAS